MSASTPTSSSTDRRRILVVDDEEDLAELVSSALGFGGYDVVTAGRGLDALAAVERFRPHLVVLDVMLPDIDGFEVCRRLRAAGNDTPVIFLTARDTSDDTLEGFQRGGDDYLTKPFRLDVLGARVAAVLRRTTPPASAVTQYADLVLDDVAHLVTRAGRPVDLSPTEYRLLHFLLRHPEQVLSKDQIVEHVWGYDFDGDPKVVETYISYLRRKIDATDPPLITTVRGFGYTLRSETP